MFTFYQLAVLSLARNGQWWLQRLKLQIWVDKYMAIPYSIKRSVLSSIVLTVQLNCLLRFHCKLSLVWKQFLVFRSCHYSYVLVKSVQFFLEKSANLCLQSLEQSKHCILLVSRRPEQKWTTFYGSLLVVEVKTHVYCQLSDYRVDLSMNLRPVDWSPGLDHLHEYDHVHLPQGSFAVSIKRM